MIESAGEASQHVLFIGSGHSQVEVLRQFAMNPMGGVRKTLVTPDYHAPYSGMLPGLVAGHYTFEECHINVAPLARQAGTRFIHGAVERLDLERKVAYCGDRPPIAFDFAAINIGSRPREADVPGAAEFALPAKPVDAFLRGWSRIVQRALEEETELRIVTVGGGAGGVELALAMRHRLRRERENVGKDPDQLRFEIVNAAERILPTHNDRVRQRMIAALDARGVRVHNGTTVERVTEEAIRTESGESIAFDELVWVTQAAAQPWIRESGLATDSEGFIEVDETLRSTSHPFVFAAGDIAYMRESPRPKSGVFAVRQGPYLSSNVRRALRGESLEKFGPQEQFLSLISTGDQNAIASRGRFCFEGRWVWRWKDRIDRAFMDKYDVLGSDESMTPDDAMEQMRCGGCGCKLGGDILSTALADIEQSPGVGIVIGLDKPDDAAVVEIPEGAYAVHSVDFFRSFIDDPYIFGQVTAHHCLTDLYAMGATPHTALAMATIGYEDAGFAGDTLSELLQGAVKVLQEAGATLVGGHTTEGPELSFGLSVNGYVMPELLLRKAGMNPGDKLIVTKSIGTGVIFAGEMQGVARGSWIESAVQTMLQSNKKAMELLRGAGATASTDITGFGLLTHLAEMTESSGRDVELNLDALPVLDGAARLSREGVQSTLYPANARRARALRDAPEDHPNYPLLFDPQTSGGLIAAVPADRADACLQTLRGAGYSEASIVGEATSGTEGAIVLSG